MARKTPVLLRRAPLTGGVNVLTNYRWKNGGEILQATTYGKHDVTADFDALVLETLLDPDSPDMVEILDSVYEREALSEIEPKQVLGFRDHLVALIERHNTSGHGAARDSTAARSSPTSIDTVSE